MSVQELKLAYDALPESDRILFDALTAAERMVSDPEYVAEISRRQKEMDQGKKLTHQDLIRLHEELGQRGL